MAWQHVLTARLIFGAERDIAVLDSTWDEGVSVGAAAKKVQVVILGTGEAWMQHAIAAMGHSFRGRAAGACMRPLPGDCSPTAVCSAKSRVSPTAWPVSLTSLYMTSLMGQGEDTSTELLLVGTVHSTPSYSATLSTANAWDERRDPSQASLILVSTSALPLLLASILPIHPKAVRLLQALPNLTRRQRTC